jgi:Armadillo/beta-catenin-like repeat
MFLPPLLRQLKSAKEDVRANAVTAVESLALRCKDIEVRAQTLHK